MKNITHLTQFQHKTFLPIMVLLAVGYSVSAGAETTECTQITTIPTVISDQGVYCLKSNLATSISTGNAIDIQTNNVTIDFNNFKLGGLNAGLGTEATGVFAENRTNITLRNGNIRGFGVGIQLEGSGGGHVIENNRLDKNRIIGVFSKGTGNIIRDNQINDTGVSTIVDLDLISGIVIEGPGAEVTDNKIDNTSGEADSVVGIVLESDAAIIMRNRVTRTINTGEGQDFGIAFDESDSGLVKDNVIINNSINPGTTGIFGSSVTQTLCKDNIIVQFFTGVDECLDETNTLMPAIPLI